MLLSSIGVVDKISHLTKITPDNGDILLVLGETSNELEDSVYSKIIGYEKSKVVLRKGCSFNCVSLSLQITISLLEIGTGKNSAWINHSDNFWSVDSRVSP